VSFAGTWGYELPPDDPARRVYWVLPLAVLLVLLAMLGLTRLMKSTTERPPPPPPPVRAEFYELPGITGPKPQPGREHPVAKPAPRAPLAPPAPAAVPPKPAAPPAPVVHAPAKRAPRAHPRERQRAAAPVERSRGQEPVEAAPRAAPEAAAPAPPRQIDWGHINEDVKSAVASTLADADFQRVRNPDSLVAKYYLAEVLRKLEHVGEMSYLGTMVGEVTVIFVIGPDGEVDNLAIWQSSGNPELDDYAKRIVRMSAPFARFSDTLERESMQLKLKVDMVFEGFREVEAR
jgi:protein TonB